MPHTFLLCCGTWSNLFSNWRLVFSAWAINCVMWLTINHYYEDYFEMWQVKWVKWLEILIALRKLELFKLDNYKSIFGWGDGLSVSFPRAGLKPFAMTDSVSLACLHPSLTAQSPRWFPKSRTSYCQNVAKCREPKHESNYDVIIALCIPNWIHLQVYY